MPKYLRAYDSDYVIASKPGGEIRLDTGNEQGTVIVTGNLDVRGTTTEINSTEVTLEDNIIVLSAGNTDSGLPNTPPINGRSGIEIDRGTSPNARWVYDESISWQLGGTSGQGTFYAERGEQGEKLPLNTPGIVAQGTLYVDTGNGVISVTNTSNYEEKVFNYVSGELVPDSNGDLIIDDDHIPNAKAVVDLVDFNFQNRGQVFIEQGDTRVSALDETHVLESIVSITNSGNGSTVIQTQGPHGFTDQDSVNISGIQANGDPLENLNQNNIEIIEIISFTSLRLDVEIVGANPESYIQGSGTVEKVGASQSRVEILVDDVNIANFFENSFRVADFEIQANIISTTDTNEDLVLTAPGTGSVQIDDILELKTAPWDSDPNNQPTSVQDGIKLYAADESTGKTGLFYVNSSDTRDEIASKNRTLLFSMLF